jgi:tryptophan-rich sensory protein
MRKTTILGLTKANGLLLIAFMLAPLLIGYVGSAFTMPQIPGWYAELVKPALNPPSFVFGPVWTTLYLLMGIAAFRIFKKRDAHPQLARRALILYGVHLFVNLAWSLVFFGGQDPEMAVAVIALLWAMIVSLVLLFSRIDKPAALLLLPYLLWVSFASYLNIAIAILN